MEEIFDQMNNEVDKNTVDKQCAEIEKKNLLIENENLIVNCLSTQLLYDVAKSRCLDLEADVSKVHDESKLISNLREYLNLQLKYQHLQESFDNKKSQASQEAPDFRSFFKIKNLEHQIQEKDNVIRHLKDRVANVNDRSRVPYNAIDVTALVEQNDCYRVELEKVKQHYKELYDSIKSARVHTSEKTSTMLNEIESLKAQLRSKEPCFTSDYVKPKVLAPGMYAIDVKPIPHPLKNNRSAHLNYVKHLKESVETVREIVEEARVVKPLDNSLNYACQYTKLSQELLECVIGTCPKSFNERDNKAPSTPVTRKKQVTFSDAPGTSSSNTQKHEVHQKFKQVPKPDLALELGKSISLTEAEEEAVAREVHATHARIVSGPDPEPMQEDQTGSNSGKLHVSLAGPNPEHMDDEFLATAYPKVHENLKLITDERVIEENPESHSGSMSSMKNLDDTYNFGDQFLYDKPTEDDQEKSKVIEESDSTIPDPSHQTVTSTPPVIAPFTDVSSTKPSSLVTPPPINTEATTITTSLPEITPFIALQLRVARLEQEMSEVKKTDHSADVLASIKSQVPTVVDKYLGTKLDDALLKILERHTADLIEKYSALPGPESIKNQESEKSPKEIIRIKREQGEEKQDSTYSIRSTDKVALEEFDLKSALFKHMNKNKTANRNPANYHLYHALMEALIADEDAMDKEVAVKVKDHKRKHDSDDEEDDDDDEGPSAGSNQGRSAKRRRPESAASGSAQPPSKDDHQSSKKPRESDASASKQHPALTSTGWQITDTRDDVVNSLMHMLPNNIQITDTNSFIVSKKRSSDSSKKLKGIQTLTPAEQEAADIMKALKESKKMSKRQPGTGGSNEGTGNILGVPDEEKLIL
ncbi:hypothetical protein Tco_0993281 [Tanacetum coccineum]|uniref:Uncharacterized protein n=1 Tax=Tanacetum coccineum TaxID=301880 RepID=A0ABQ5F688_9ASTR